MFIWLCLEAFGRHRQVKIARNKNSSKKTEGIIIGNIINLWNSFGQCESVKIG